MQSGGVKHALNPDPYRGRFGDAGPAYAEAILHRTTMQSSDMTGV